ncbi:hypothetical protein AV656_03100 [Bhargavaea cecembensis]|uniref:DUF421 domain-containing protein n=1 Tax=Bhargavaea cecembensis TaxID=394098 RepID=A0A163GI98_9BACL|nr:DUF421 domain-containing protein [Bhargavaea cecembensis]KZE40266.1 hypothetical protein AV656_03100 [Bhargavaea cecembensis]
MEYLVTILRSLFAFFTLLLLTRIMGKKQMSQLTYFNYIAGITIGSITADLAVRSDRDNTLHDLIALIVWGGAVILLGVAGLKSKKTRLLIDGEPSILIRKGIVQEDVLSQVRLNMNDLSMMLRQKKAFSISGVEYAILEPNGQLSVMLKPEKLPVTKEDLQVPQKVHRNLPTTIILDGQMANHEMDELGLSPDWVIGELKKQNITSVSDVFYAEYLPDGTLAIQRKKER